MYILRSSLSNRYRLLIWFPRVSKKFMLYLGNKFCNNMATCCSRSPPIYDILKAIRHMKNIYIYFKIVFASDQKRFKLPLFGGKNISSYSDLIILSKPVRKYRILFHWFFSMGTPKTQYTLIIIKIDHHLFNCVFDVAILIPT